MSDFKADWEEAVFELVDDPEFTISSDDVLVRPDDYPVFVRYRHRGSNL